MSGTGSTVTERVPATEPAKVTEPSAGARTIDPSGAAKSTPQWPPNLPTGANSEMIGPGTGGETQISGIATGSAERNNEKTIPNPMSRPYEMSTTESRALQRRVALVGVPGRPGG